MVSSLTGEPLRPEREEFPQLPTYGRGGRDGIMSVYIILLLLSIKRIQAHFCGNHRTTGSSPF